MKDVDVFPKNMFGEIVMEKMTGLKYWRNMKTKIINENKNSDPEDEVLRFYTLMIKLHSCCATSAGIERIFSVFGIVWVWTKLRNSLSPKKVVKLVQTYRNLNKNLT
jgi:hypothetical protein